MKNKNRLTPFLIISLIILIWILLAVLIFKNSKIEKIVDNEKRIKINDGLIQELYDGILDEDIKFFDTGDYTLDNLPKEYIISKATRFMTSEDIVLGKQNFILNEDTLTNAIKMGFGPDIKYNLTNIKEIVATELYYEDKLLELNVKYDAIKKYYYGTYNFKDKEDNIKVYKSIVKATKDDYINLYINYIFYTTENDNIYVCNDIKCTKKDKINNLSKSIFKNKYGKKIIVSYKKAGDDVFYYYKNVIDK